MTKAKVMDSLKSEKSRLAFIQFIKYGLSGAAATCVHLLVFYIMAIWVLPALTATDPVFKVLKVDVPVVDVDTLIRAKRAAWDNGVAFVISNFTAYVLNVLFVFKAGRHHWAVEIGLFYLVSGVSLLIGTLLQSALIAKLGLSTTLAFGANMVSSLMINYAMRKFVIFKG